ALAWATTGPHLDRHLAAGEWSVDVFMGNLMGTYEEIWKTLAEWKQLDPEDQKRFARLIDKAYSRYLPELREARHARLVRLLEALRE
ncbi:MAG TPA: hypothetical protein VNH46_10255, partial [Gemmatimonadales bacterium]|nr:hypothetical protein [Gemmatimonadales bacterium]